MSEKDDSILTKQQAKELVVDRCDRMVHTFYNPPFGLIGADHTKKSVFEDIDNAFVCKKTGESASGMGHGLAIIPNKKCKQSDILFVETKQKETSK